TAALGTLGTVWKKVGELGALDARFTPYLDARESLKSQLEDLAFFLRSYAADIDDSPARLQEVEDRLALIERLKKKYGPSLGDVLAARAALKQELHQLAHATERATELDARLAATRQAYQQLAGDLSARRREAAHVFTRALVTALADLAMPTTKCE